MISIDKQALRMRNYLNTAVISGVKLLHLTTDELSGLLDELESKQTFQQAFFRQSLMYDVVAEAYEEAKEQIAKDVEIKARQCLESNSLFDRLRAAEKRIAELEARTYIPQPLDIEDEYQNYEYVAGWNDCRNAASVRKQTAALCDVIAERYRQLSVEGWTPEHDDEHVSGEIAAFAAIYAMPEVCRDWETHNSLGYGDTLLEAVCPVDWTPKFVDRRRDLVKAGALIIAEIERIDRAAGIAGG